MKGKKTAFSNTSTGYGKAKSTHNHKHHNNNNNSKQERSEHKTDDDKKVDGTQQHDNDLNSGFGDYLRSPEGWAQIKNTLYCTCIFLVYNFLRSLKLREIIKFSPKKLKVFN